MLFIPPALYTVFWWQFHFRQVQVRFNLSTLMRGKSIGALREKLGGRIRQLGVRGEGSFYGFSQICFKDRKGLRMYDKPGDRCIVQRRSKHSVGQLGLRMVASPARRIFPSLSCQPLMPTSDRERVHGIRVGWNSVAVVHG